MEQIREIEKVVDKHHLNAAYLKKSFQQAVFDLLRAYEDANHLSALVDVFKGGASGLDSIKRDLMDGLNQALHWVYENKKDEDVVFNFEMDEADYVNALEFINEYAIPYSKVCDAYVAYSRNRFTGEVDGKDIFFKTTATQSMSFSEEMGEFFEKYGTIEQYASRVEQIIQNGRHYIQKVFSTIDFSDGRICYKCDGDAVGVFRSVADLHWNETAILPSDWAFNDFTLEQYRKCWRELYALGGLHTLICMNCKDAIAYKDCVIVQKKSTIISYLCQMIQEDDLSEDKINTILDYITFDPNLKHGDIMYQPLVVINDWLLFTPSLLSNGNPERNLVALIQQKNKDKKHFDEVNQLESLMREQIEEQVRKRNDSIALCNNIKIWQDKQLITDVDFGLYDAKSQSVLLCEMKWLLSADASSEVFSREDEVDHGCGQAEISMGYAMVNSHDFMKKAFDIDNETPIEFFCCVITKADVRGNNRHVPVISQRKFIQLIESNKEYREIFESIRNRSYYEPIDNGTEYKDYIFSYAGYTFHVPALIIPDEVLRVN